MFTDQKEAVKAATDIVSLIGETVSLTKRGRQFVGLCPFHGEKNPSFNVFPDGRYHCFGCSEGGDVIAFVRKRDNLTFGEALKLLADRAGIQLVTTDPRVEAQKSRLYKAMAVANEFFQQQLASSSEAMEYLLKRGFTPETLIRFELGYLPKGASVRPALKASGISDDDAVGASILGRYENRVYDFYGDGRLMFPIRDATGKLVSFSGRILDETQRHKDGSKLAKYKNGLLTSIFHKSDVLYGLYDCLQQRGFDKDRTAVVVEGYADVIIPHQEGFNNVIAVMGTAFTPFHARRLQQKVDSIVIALDPDVAGQKGTEKVIVALRNSLIELMGSEEKLGITIKIAELPEGKDPDELVLEDPQLWQRCVADAPTILDRAFNRHKDLKLHDLAAKKAAWEEIAPYMRALNSPLALQHYRSRLRHLLNMEESELDAVLSSTAKPKEDIPPPTKPAKVTPGNSNPLELRVLHALLVYPEAYQGAVAADASVALSADDFLHGGLKGVLGSLLDNGKACPDLIDALETFGEDDADVLQSVYATPLLTTEKSFLESLCTLKRAGLRRKRELLTVALSRAMSGEDTLAAQKLDQELGAVNVALEAAALRLKSVVELGDRLL